MKSKTHPLQKTIFSFLLAFTLLLSAHGQLLLNGGFEETTVIEGQATTAHWSVDPTGGKLVNDAHSGKWALSLWNWYVWVRGWACYGEGDAMNCLGKPTNEIPVALTGWYKYLPGINDGAADSAVCFVTITNPPNSEGHADTVSFVRSQLSPSESFKQFKIQIPYMDFPKPGFSAAVQFLSSEHGNCGSKSGGNCLYLTVDDLALEPLVFEEIGFLDVSTESLDPNDYKLIINSDDKGFFPCIFTLTDHKGAEILNMIVDAKGKFENPVTLLPADYPWKIITADGKTYTGSLHIDD